MRKRRSGKHLKIYDQSSMNKRAMILYCVVISVMSILLARLVFFLNESEKYSCLANKNGIVRRIIVPPRGCILDRNGLILADERKVFALSLLAKDQKELKLFVSKISNEVPLEKLCKKEGQLYNFPISSNHFIVAELLDWNDVEEIEKYRTEFPGIMIDEYRVRNYPYADICLHFVGCVRREVKKGNLVYESRNVGRSGLETMFDEALRGIDGAIFLKVNSKRKVVNTIPDSSVARAGTDICTSLDVRLQEVLYNELKDFRSACGVLIKAETGEILAMVSIPSCDPNKLSGLVSQKEVNELMGKSGSPFFNKTTNSVFSPGSTIKLMISVAALLSCAIDKNTTFCCNGTMEYGGRDFHCMHNHGTLTVKDALAKSCNIFFYNVAKRLSLQSLVSTLKILGFSEHFDGVPSMKNAILPKKRNFNIGDMMLASIGAGDSMATTLLHLAVFTARLVTDTAVVPTCVVSNSKFPKLNLNQNAINTVKQGMFDCANMPYGTAYSIHDSRIAAKTGTAEVVSSKHANKSIWALRSHALCCAYSPYGNSDCHYVVCILLEHEGGRGFAPKIVKAVLLKAMELDENIKEDKNGS